MGALLKLILCLYAISLIFTLICGLFRFWIDVAKWHDKEKVTKVTPSIFNYDIVKGGEDNGRTERAAGSGTGAGDNDNNGTGAGAGYNDNNGFRINFGSDNGISAASDE